ncbi:restriction endonuclease [Pseudobacter ginsenosidimutans]|uniref:restriction endonuclease n=2 Tax=Pseudobacter ginsenosidimutans TaxID=661488 RepID=UPI00102D9D6C|nr:restriction endonuclease [Pseudobacter ginsenosidimutans]
MVLNIKVFSLAPMKRDPFLTIVQAKQSAFNKKVGEAAIRNLVGTVQIQKAVRGQLVTNSDFTKPASRTARVVKIDLIKFYELVQEVNKLEME